MEIFSYIFLFPFFWSCKRQAVNTSKNYIHQPEKKNGNNAFNASEYGVQMGLGGGNDLIQSENEQNRLTVTMENGLGR